MVLKCDENLLRCRCEPDEDGEDKDKPKDYLESKNQCRLIAGETCSGHAKCVTEFCKGGKCTRQKGHGQACETGMNEECTTFYCHKKMCQYKENVIASTGAQFQLSKIFNTLIHFTPILLFL